MHEIIIFTVGGILLITLIMILIRWIYVRSRLLRRQIQVTRLLTSITDDLLTPLTVLSIAIERLRDAAIPEFQEYEFIDLNIQRSIRLLQQIKDVNKTQEGELRLQVRNTDIMRHIKEMACSIKPLMDDKKVVFNIECRPESMMGWADIDKLEKIIFNLLLNAYNNTDEGGFVKISATTSPYFDHVNVQISHQGINIPKEQQKTETALISDLVYLHRGEIEHHTKEDSTVYNISLPIKKEAFNEAQIDETQKKTFDIPSRTIIDFHSARLTTDDSKNMASPDAPRILIVEENYELMRLMKQLLQPAYNIMTASNGREALDVIHAQHVDLIVSEVATSEVNGFELTTQLKKSQDYGHIPIILLTGQRQDEERIEALTAGADGILTKPFKLRELQLQIGNIITNRQRMIYDKLAMPDKQVEEITSSNSVDQEFLRRAIECVNQHITDSDYDRESFAADMGSSVSTLYNKIRALTGKSVTNFTRDIRIKTACRLAKEHPELRVSDIAYQVGFKDPKYFATSFKRVMGIQPKEYFNQVRTEK